MSVESKQTDFSALKTADDTGNFLQRETFRAMESLLCVQPSPDSSCGHQVDKVEF
jgi:hypothetical protein